MGQAAPPPAPQPPAAAQAAAGARGGRGGSVCGTLKRSYLRFSAAGSRFSRYLLGFTTLLENSEENLSPGASPGFYRAPVRRFPRVTDACGPPAAPAAAETRALPSPPAPAGRPPGRTAQPAAASQRHGVGAERPQNRERKPLRGAAGPAGAAHSEGPSRPGDGEGARARQAGRGSATWIRFLCLRRSAMLSPSAPPVTWAGAGGRQRRQHRERWREPAEGREGRSLSAAHRARRRRRGPRCCPATASITWGKPGSERPRAGSPLVGRPGSETSLPARVAGLGWPPHATVWLIRNSPRGRCSLSCSLCPRLSRGAQAPPSKVQLPNQRGQPGRHIAAYSRREEAEIGPDPGHAVHRLEHLSAPRRHLIPEEWPRPAAMKVLQHWL